MDILLKAAAAAVIAAVLGLIIKKSNPESALLLALAAAVMILLLTFSAAGKISGFVLELGETSGVSPAIAGIVMKTAAISIIAKLTGDVCRDAGQSALGTALEILGAVTAVYIALPLFETVLDTMEKLL